MKHYNIVISGLVQGVYYRLTAKQKAIELGLHGFVKNTPEGMVYAEAEGEPGQLDAFVAWCKEGPIMAEVEQVTVTEGELQAFNGFGIS